MSEMEISSHHSRLLHQLNEQRQQDFFCDCHILIQGRTFKAHRNVLFASSGYFKMLLSQSSKEACPPSTATFEVFSPETFHVILDFMYTGKLSLNGQTVIEVMSAASYLQMTDVIGACKTFIKSSLDINEKEKDDFFNLSEKDTKQGINGNGDEQTEMYGLEWEVAESSLQHSRVPPEGGKSTSDNSWNVYNYYKAFQRSTQERPAKQDHKHDSAKKQSRHLREQESGDVPDSKQIKEEPAPETCRISKPKGFVSQSEEPVPIEDDVDAGFPLDNVAGMTPRTWTVNQPSQSRRSASKSKSSKADELYATMPTILGVVGGWGEDDMPRMRFKCPFCTHMVKRKADLKRHLRCHTGERPYPCEACGKRFTRLEHLRSHFRTIHQAGKPICRKCKRHVTDLTGQVVQEGTRRYRLCNECLSEAGVESIPIDLDDDEDDESSLVFSPSPDDEKDSGWQVGSEQRLNAEIMEDGSSDLVIHQVDDSDDEVEENDVKPRIS
ncbi:zinc finger and BTB domain-containing protein 8A [Lissotriton helveticus]